MAIVITDQTGALALKTGEVGGDNGNTGLSDQARN
jgi:hypothetical protein